jgi:DNA-binding ferritin-like protein (Dps family)
MLDAIKKFIKLIIGDPWDSRGYKQMMKRVKALPKDYQYVFRKIKHYMTVHGVGPDGDLTIFTNLVDLFEASAAEGRQVLEVIGSDVGEFCNELIRTSVIHANITEKMWGNINKEVMEKFNKEGQ